MNQPHRQCAGVVVLNGAGQVLLIRQNYGQRFWGTPGGIVDPGETPMQAARREALEEAGIRVEITGVIGLYLLQGGGWPNILAHVFQAQITGQRPRVGDEREIAAVQWFNLDHLPTPLVPDAEAALEDVLARKMGVVRAVQRKVAMPPLHAP